MSESFLTKMLITRPLELLATEGPMVNRQQSIEPLKKQKKKSSKKKCIFKWNALEKKKICTKEKKKNTYHFPLFFYSCTQLHFLQVLS